MRGPSLAIMSSCIAAPTIRKWREKTIRRRRMATHLAVNKMNNGHSCNSLTLVNVFVSIQFRIPGDFRSALLRQPTAAK